MNDVLNQIINFSQVILLMKKMLKQNNVEREV